MSYDVSKWKAIRDIGMMGFLAAGTVAIAGIVFLSMVRGCEVSSRRAEAAQRASTLANERVRNTVAERGGIYIGPTQFFVLPNTTPDRKEAE